MPHPAALGHISASHLLDKTFPGPVITDAFDRALLIFLFHCAHPAGWLRNCTATFWFYPLLQTQGKAHDGAGSASSKNCPRVTVQLPIFNEQYVVEASAGVHLQVEIPREKPRQFKCSTIPPTKPSRLARNLVVTLRRAVAIPSAITITCTNREGFKAGALGRGPENAKGEVRAIFDADFTPPEDFLLRTVHHFTIRGSAWCRRAGRTSIGIIFSDRGGGHPVDATSCWSTPDAPAAASFFNFNGTARSLAATGDRRSRRLAARHAHRRHRSFPIVRSLKGWKFIYLQDVECPAELPVRNDRVQKPSRRGGPRD